MPYRCTTCDWTDERDKPACTRCGSAAITELTPDELVALFDSKQAIYCNVCERVHTR